MHEAIIQGICLGCVALGSRGARTLGLSQALNGTYCHACH